MHLSATSIWRMVVHENKHSAFWVFLIDKMNCKKITTFVLPHQEAMPDSFKSACSMVLLIKAATVYWAFYYISQALTLCSVLYHINVFLIPTLWDFLGEGTKAQGDSSKFTQPGKSELEPHLCLAGWLQNLTPKCCCAHQCLLGCRLCFFFLFKTHLTTETFWFPE